MPTDKAEEDTFAKEEEEGGGLGYDIDEASDFSVPDDLDVRQRPELLRWRYREGGHRIPLFVPKIPHVDETTIPLHMLRDEAEILAMCEKIASETRQAQGEQIYAKQQADALQQEKDLLKWHMANNSKVLAVKRNELQHNEQRNLTLKNVLQAVFDENETYEKAQEALKRESEKLQDRLDEVQQELEDTQDELREWLSRRGDYIADTAMERRRANHERSLRLRQWNKLSRACNADKRLHAKLDTLKRRDEIVYDMSKETTRFLSTEYDNAGSVIGKARDKMADPDKLPRADTILADFVSSAVARAEAEAD